MAQSDYKQGQQDAAQGKGAKRPQDFGSAQERNDYFAGYNKK